MRKKKTATRRPRSDRDALRPLELAELDQVKGGALGEPTGDGSPYVIGEPGGDGIPY